jgi:hypothetical protein
LNLILNFDQNERKNILHILRREALTASIFDELGIHRNLRTTWKEISSQKWTISFVNQGKFKVGVVPADRQGCYLLEIFVIIVIMVGGSLAMSAGANTTILGQ